MAAEAFDQKLKNQIKYLKLNCIEFGGFEGEQRFSPTVSSTGTCSHFYDFDHDGNTEAQEHQEPDNHSTGMRHHLFSAKPQKKARSKTFISWERTRMTSDVTHPGSHEYPCFTICTHDSGLFRAFPIY